MLPNLRIRIRLDERQLTEVVLDEIYHLIGPFGHDGRRPSMHDQTRSDAAQYDARA